MESETPRFCLRLALAGRAQDKWTTMPVSEELKEAARLVACLGIELNRMLPGVVPAAGDIGSNGTAGSVGPRNVSDCLR